MSEQIDEKPRARGSMGDFAVFAAPDEVDFNPVPAGIDDETPRPMSRREARAAESGSPKPVLSRMAEEADHDLLSGQEIYQDTEKSVGISGHKFPAGSSLTLGKRNAYRVNARGAVLFTPGWTPKRVVGVHLRAGAIWMFLVAASVAGCLGMYGAHVGSDRAYNELLADGQQITATVSDSKISAEQVSTGYISVQEVTEKATAPFTTKSGKKGAASTSSQQQIKLEETYKPAHPKGSTLDIIAMPDNPKRWMLANPDAPKQLNWVSASPLAIGFFASMGVLARVHSANKMARLGNAMARARK